MGHSRGGALAIILAAHLRMDLDLNVTTYTYGSPRVGNEAFARFVFGQGDRNYRITHYNDIVPLVPPSRLSYQHIEPEYWLREGPWSRVNYKPRDLEECTSWIEEHCIEGVIGYDWLRPSVFLSHSYYLAAISQCGKPGAAVLAADELFWDTAEGERLMETLRRELAEDISYTASQYNSSLLDEFTWTSLGDN